MKQNHTEAVDFKKSGIALASCDITVCEAKEIASHHERDESWDFWQSKEVKDVADCQDHDKVDV